MTVRKIFESNNLPGNILESFTVRSPLDVFSFLTLKWCIISTLFSNCWPLRDAELCLKKLKKYRINIVENKMQTVILLIFDAVCHHDKYVMIRIQLEIYNTRL